MNRKQRIETQLKLNLAPLFLEVLDESHRHHVPENAQTHFKVTAVSQAFEGLSLVKRHRLVNDLLSIERDNGMHALTMQLKTAAEWDSGVTKLTSPPCRDGYKHD